MQGNIRQVYTSDAETYRKLRLKSLKEHPEAFTSSWEYESTQPLEWFEQRLATAVRFGYFEQGQLLAVVGLLLNEEDNALRAGHRATVINVYVDPSLRGKGVGRALFATLFDYAKKAGLEILQLGVGTFNTSAIALYEAMGFQRYGVEKHALKVNGTYIDEFLMHKEL